jgi:hypothetical protein
MSALSYKYNWPLVQALYALYTTRTGIVFFKDVSNSDLIDLRATGRAQIIYDVNDNKVKISENNGPFVPIIQTAPLPPTVYNFIEGLNIDITQVGDDITIGTTNIPYFTEVYATTMNATDINATTVNSNNITVIENDIVDINNNITSINTSLGTINTDITNINTSLSNKISTGSNASLNTLSIAGDLEVLGYINYVDIGLVKSQVDFLLGDNVTNKANISTNTTNITTNTNSITTINTDITNIESDITSINTSLSNKVTTNSDASLSSLTVPILENSTSVLKYQSPNLTKTDTSFFIRNNSQPILNDSSYIQLDSWGTDDNFISFYNKDNTKGNYFRSLLNSVPAAAFISVNNTNGVVYDHMRIGTNSFNLGGAVKYNSNKIEYHNGTSYKVLASEDYITAGTNINVSSGSISTSATPSFTTVTASGNITGNSLTGTTGSINTLTASTKIITPAIQSNVVTQSPTTSGFVDTSFIIVNNNDVPDALVQLDAWNNGNTYLTLLNKSTQNSYVRTSIGGATVNIITMDNATATYDYLKIGTLNQAQSGCLKMESSILKYHNGTSWVSVLPATQPATISCKVLNTGGTIGVTLSASTGVTAYVDAFGLGIVTVSTDYPDYLDRNVFCILAGQSYNTPTVITLSCNKYSSRLWRITCYADGYAWDFRNLLDTAFVEFRVAFMNSV